MAIAVVKVTGPNPTQQPALLHFISGWGPNAIYATAALALAWCGAGRWSLTAWYLRRRGEGRVGEVICRTWQTAHKMKVQFGAIQGDDADSDNLRARRYVAKYTINPAITHGIAHEVGSVEVGKLADLCLWKPAFFGVKPSLVIKGGFIAAAPMGDPNASIPTPQPVHYRYMFGAFGRAPASTAVTFVSRVAADGDVAGSLGLAKRCVAVAGTRAVTKADMKLNDYCPRMEVDPQTYEVRADGRVLTCEPVRVLPLAQRYFLF